jgi:hypothetical protein
MPQREVLEHQGALGPDPADETGEDEGDHGGHHPGGRPEVQCSRGGWNKWKAQGGARHLSDERADLRGDGRAAWSLPAALPGPEEREAGPLPSDHGRGLDDGDGIRPAVPEAG